MQKKKLDKIEEKLRQVYFDYFTDYMVFSEQYSNLLEGGFLDEFVKSDYIYYLYEQVKNIEENNVYPTSIIYNFLEFTSLLEEQAESLLDEKQITSLKPLFQKMYLILASESKNDSTEIYYSEYMKRYSNVRDLGKIKGISVEKLVIDIQLDFLYLDILMTDGVKEIDKIGPDFYYFLQKLMIDFPEVKDYPYTRNTLKDIIKAKNDERLNEYLPLINSKKIYRNNSGFNVDTMELLYMNTLIQKMIFTGKTKKILENMDPKVILTVPFFNNLCNEFKRYIEKNEISTQEKNAYEEIISYMRSHMNECCEEYKSSFNSVINSWITFLNICPTTNEVTPMYSSSLSKSGDLGYIDALCYHKNETYYKNIADVQMELAYDIMSYFFGKENLDELKEDGIYTISALTYLFSEYPKMFFDPTIYEKAMSLIEGIKCKKSDKLKKKLYQIRKNK